MRCSLLQVGGKPQVMPMIRAIVVMAILLPIGVAHAGAFCDDAPFVSFDQLIREKDSYLNMRVRTHGVLRTDAKETTLIKQDERTKLGLKVESDSAAQEYASEHRLPSDPSFNVVSDFLDKLQQRDGDKAPVDMSKVASYRQERRLCGRVVKGSGEYGFVIDDSILETTYLVPSKSK
jgi:hypothetical protein